MTDKRALVIDTSRHIFRQPQIAFGEHSPLSGRQTPCISSSSWSSTGSSSAPWSKTPSTALTHVSTDELCDSRRLAKADPDCMLTKIDEYLADLNSPSLHKRRLRHRLAKLRIKVVPSLSVMQASSTPVALKTSSFIKTRPGPSLCSPEHDLLSPFDQYFKLQQGRIQDDTAPFPYSPWRESVVTDPDVFARILFRRRGDNALRIILSSHGSEGLVMSDESASESPPCSTLGRMTENEPLGRMCGLTALSENSPRSASQDGTRLSDALPRTQGAYAPVNERTYFTRSEPEFESAPLSLQVDSVIPQTRSCGRGLARSVSTGDFPELPSRQLGSSVDILVATVSRSSTLGPNLYSCGWHPVTDTPLRETTSNSDVNPQRILWRARVNKSQRSVNKLKKLLGDEVGSPITSPTTTRHGTAFSPNALMTRTSPSPSPVQLRGNATFQPVSYPSSHLNPRLQRSNTVTTMSETIEVGRRAMLGSHKPRRKKCCVEESDSRPATAI